MSKKIYLKTLLRWYPFKFQHQGIKQEFNQQNSHQQRQQTQQDQANKHILFAQLLLTLILSSLLIGCNINNSNEGFLRVSGNTDQSSRLAIPDSQDSAPKDVALCNQLQDPLITVQLMVFYDQYNNYRPEYLRLYIPQIDAEFAKSNYQLILRKWKADVNGETYQDNTPLKLFAERKVDRIPVTPFMDTLQWNILSNHLESSLKTSFTLADAFKKFNFVIDLKDPSGAFDVLKFSLYNKEEWVSDWNILIPAFYAHPKTYATNQNSVLAKLHPFYGQESSELGKELASKLNSYCF